MQLKKSQILKILKNFGLKYEYRENNRRLPHVVYDPQHPEEKKEFPFFGDVAYFVEGLYRGTEGLGGHDRPGPISCFDPAIGQSLKAL